MPVIKSAKKKLRQDKKRTIENKKVLTITKKLIKKARKEVSKKIILEAVKSIDKAVKKGIFHKNKAARLKSQLAKLVKVAPEKKTISKKSKQSKK